MSAAPRHSVPPFMRSAEEVVRTICNWSTETLQTAIRWMEDVPTSAPSSRSNGELHLLDLLFQDASLMEPSKGYAVIRRWLDACRSVLEARKCTTSIPLTLDEELLCQDRRFWDFYQTLSFPTNTATPDWQWSYREDESKVVGSVTHSSSCIQVLDTEDRLQLTCQWYLQPRRGTCIYWKDPADRHWYGLVYAFGELVRVIEDCTFPRYSELTLDWDEDSTAAVVNDTDGYMVEELLRKHPIDVVRKFRQALASKSDADPTMPRLMQLVVNMHKTSGLPGQWIAITGALLHSMEDSNGKMPIHFPLGAGTPVEWTIKKAPYKLVHDVNGFPIWVWEEVGENQTLTDGEIRERVSGKLVFAYGIEDNLATVYAEVEGQWWEATYRHLLLVGAREYDVVIRQD